MEKKKDLRVQKTYSALMAAFEALMAEETFDDITINELCARALIRMGLRSKSLPIIFEIISEHIFASSSRRVRAYCGPVTDSPELADTLVTFIVGGLIQNLKRYLTEPNLDPDALTAEIGTVFEHLWNFFAAQAEEAAP